jgi:competence protein ComEC
MLRAALLWLCTLGSAWAGSFTVEVLDIGQGDSLLLRSPAGKVVLIDAGTGNPDVVPMLRARGVTQVDLAIGTHPHADHIGGMDEVLEAFPVRVYMDNGLPHTTATYTRVMSLVESRGVAYKPGLAGQVVNLDDGIRIEVLNPHSPALTGTRSDLNSNSVVTRVTHGEVCLLLTGDSEEPTEQLLVQKGLGPCGILKVAHHGSAHSTTDSFLRAVKPTDAIISAGVDNRYGHPTEEAMHRISAAGARIHRTDLSGTIRITSDGRTARIEAVGKESGGAKASAVAASAPEERPVAAAPAPSKAPAPAAARPPGTLGPSAGALPKSPPAGRAPVDLNRATLTDLDGLPGIGPARAQAILTFREANGPFRALADLDAVPGIGPATIAGLEGWVIATPEQASP